MIGDYVQVFGVGEGIGGEWLCGDQYVVWIIGQVVGQECSYCVVFFWLDV